MAIAIGEVFLKGPAVICGSSGGMRGVRHVEGLVLFERELGKVRNRDEFPA